MSSSAGPAGSALHGAQHGDSQDMLPNPIVHLFLGANIPGQIDIKLDKEHLDDIESRFVRKRGDASWNGVIEFKHDKYTQIADIPNSLLQHTPTIVHFSCHGSREQGRPGPGRLYLESGALGGEELVKSILVHNNKMIRENPANMIRLVIFNACDSAKMAELLADGGNVSEDFNGLQGVPFAIGHGGSVFNSDAEKFSKTLYSHLGDNSSLLESFVQAEMASRM